MAQGKWSTLRFTGRYLDRQRAANKAKCVLYLEQHLNALENDLPGSQDNPAMAIVCKTVGAKSKNFAVRYSSAVSKYFSVPNAGAQIRDSSGRGYYNLVYTKMPAVLLEPLSCSNEDHVRQLLTEEGQETLAVLLWDVVREQFPEGGCIGLSAGHAAKIGDLGAPLRMGGELIKVNGKDRFQPGKIVAWEHDICVKILDKFEALVAAEGAA